MARRWLFPGLNHEQADATSLQEHVWTGWRLTTPKQGLLPTSSSRDVMRVSCAPTQDPRIPVGIFK